MLAPSMAILTRFLLLLSFLCCLSQMACAVTETVRDFYQNGSYSVATVRVEKGGVLSRSLWVAIPEDAGPYPVVQFQHGFLLQNTDYTGLITQVASWGFIVVAPQMYNRLVPTDVTTEITNARSILNWMKTGLIASLPRAFANHQPDFDKVALAGHSRRGQVVLGLALNYGNALQHYSAIVGLDPVDASDPTILPHKANSMDVGVPTLIVGTGLGSQRKEACFQHAPPKTWATSISTQILSLHLSILWRPIMATWILPKIAVGWMRSVLQCAACPSARMAPADSPCADF